jgi:predicted nucleotidyltransferase
MKTTLPEKSKNHEEKIRQIADVIVNCGRDKIAFVILFGSFARGTWVFDRYSEDGILYQYSSDYDFLIITKTNKQASGTSGFDLERKIDQELERNGLISKYQGHNPHYIIEPIDRVNNILLPINPSKIIKRNLLI